jgi:hypothetical protein
MVRLAQSQYGLFFSWWLMSSRTLHQSGSTPRRSWHLHGPSEGLRAWADWCIDVHKRWHEGDPPPKAGWRLVVGGGGWLVALTAIAVKLLGG